MSTQKITERIISDAQADAEATVNTAEEKAASLLEETAKVAEQGRRETEVEVAAKRKSIIDKKAAAARLDGAKILLGEKRKVIDSIYQLALQRLLALEKEDALQLADRLLRLYAEEGDELFFADNYDYKDEVAFLPVIAEKRIKIAAQTLPLDGGMRLKGVTSDKDLSYGALLAADRDENQAELAKELFS